jgi:SAM-dependent methyltransferase
MMLGLRDSFEYFACNACGCLQIAEFPENLEKFYPDGYYSFNSTPKLSDHFLIRKVKFHRSRFQTGSKDIFGKALAKISKTPVFYEYFKNAGVNLDSKILDVGCGFGKLLLWMKREGFSNILGIDPFIKETIRYSNGLTILKMAIDELDEQFDFIMLHHSFEHMPDPAGTLRELHRLIKPSGTILIRIPVPAYAWRTFGTDWVALDAPRHFFLHTPKSIELLANQSGFEVPKIVYDSFAMQFWGSIQYQKDIPLMDPKSYLKNRKNSIFKSEEIREFGKKSALLNKQNDGDAAGFYLVKK